jgi:hypothetical protein
MGTTNKILEALVKEYSDSATSKMREAAKEKFVQLFGREPTNREEQFAFAISIIAITAILNNSIIASIDPRLARVGLVAAEKSLEIGSDILVRQTNGTLSEQVLGEVNEHLKADANKPEQTKAGESK